MCKGQRYRATITNFINLRGQLISQVRMSLLKRLSCPGCKECGGDPLPDHVAMGDIPILDNIVNGKIYRVIMVNVSHDWETGHIDNYDLKFIVDDNQ